MGKHSAPAGSATGNQYGLKPMTQQGANNFATLLAARIRQVQGQQQQQNVPAPKPAGTSQYVPSHAKPSIPQTTPSYIPRHAVNYDPKADISRSLPQAKKVNGRITPVAATYSPKHSNRNYTPVQQMRARIAASQGKVYNPANPAPVNLNAKGTKMGVYTNVPGQRKNNKKPQTLNAHQFGLHTLMNAYERVLKHHSGRNAQILEGIGKGG